jgi:hypothetical protein
LGGVLPGCGRRLEDSHEVLNGIGAKNMFTLQSNDPVAMAVVSSIRKGDVDGLKRLLTDHSDLAKARIADASGTARSLLHVAADWPGHFANGAQTVTTLVAAGRT